MNHIESGGQYEVLNPWAEADPIPLEGISARLNELAGKKIRVNQILPGRIATDRLKELDDINSKKSGIPVEEHQRRVASAIPLGRYGEPAEFARVAAFLLSDAASYLTGTTVQVDGGLTRAVL